jgi:ATP-dependent Clp protease ATP-binding subunit ClpA
MDEVRQRSSTVITPMDFGELVQAKGISRRYFKHTLEKLPSAKQFKDFETWLRAQLQAEKVNFSKIQDIVRQCQRYEVTRMDSSNTTLNQLRQTTEECLALVLAQVPRVEHLIDQLERVVLDVQAQRPMELHSYGADFCRAIAASKIYGY